MKKECLILSISALAIQMTAQNHLDFRGQVSALSSFSPDNDLDWFAGARYIPEFAYGFEVDSNRVIDFEASVNVSGSLLFHPFDQSESDGGIDPYRIWARFTAEQFELRVGLQKIDFGSATLLRPIQWFNQIDPRDPLQLTNGVYGLLGRYYFLNNANIWVWALYGNEKTRGLDVIETNNKRPEFGGRFQYPVPKGEIALSFHHRTASTADLPWITQYEKIPENRIGIDGKWDLEVGFWFEAAHIHKSKDLDIFTNQTLLNIGTDYTFGIGNGLNVIAEHLLTSYGNEAFGFTNKTNITAATLVYPLSFFDNISSVLFYNWTSDDFAYFINYEHKFNNITGYVMAFYNPPGQRGVQQNELFNQFSGPGIRLMLVYNH